MNAPAGWYPDPGDTHLTRYWDGDRYTRELRWNGTVWVEPAPPPPPAPPVVTPEPAYAAPPIPEPAAPPASVAAQPTPGVTTSQPAYVAPPIPEPAAPPAFARSEVAAPPPTAAIPPPTGSPIAGATPVARPPVTISAESLRGLPRTFWLLVGGGAAVALSAFLPWVSVEGIVSGSPTGGGILLLLGGGGGIAALAWPTMQDLVLTSGRRAGLIAVAAVLWLFVVAVWGVLISKSDSSVSAGLGLFVCTIGTVCITIGIIRVRRRATAGV